MPELRSLLRRLVRLCRSAPARLFWRHTTLEPFFEETDDAAADDASGGVVFLERVVLSGTARPAVAVTANADVVCRIHPPPAATLVVYCGVESSEAAHVRFEISIDGARTESCTVDDDRWAPLRVPVPTHRGNAPVRVVFRTNILGGRTGHVRPVWGSPALYWRRSPGDVSRMLARAVRQYGVRGALGRLAAHGSVDAIENRPAYASWLAARTPSPADLERMRQTGQAVSPRVRFAILVIGPDDAARTRTLDSLARQVYDAWEAWIWWPAIQVPPALKEVEVEVGVARGDSRVRIVADAASETDARNAMVGGSSADYVASLDAGDELAPHALFELAARAAQQSGVDMLYSDEDRLLPEGPADPRFKPGWSPEYLQSQMYLGKLLAVRRQAVQSAEGYRTGMEGAHDYDLALRISAASNAVVHVPAVLCHRGAIEQCEPAVRLAAERRALQHFCHLTGRNATVTAGTTPGVWRLRPRFDDTPRVTIVIPTDARNGPTSTGSEALVAQCLRSILERTAYPNYDLVIADNGRFPREAAALLDRVPHERVTYRWTGEFNFSRKINFAVARAQGEYVLLLNDDMEVINGEWLTAMMDHARQRAIGAVGAKLFYPDGRLQHIGVATGVCGIAAHLLHQHPAGSAGCGRIAFAVRNCSAVTGACLLTRRAVYEEVGGFDERLAVDFNDVDFCLRVRAAGYRIVYTPYAKLYHHESGSFGPRVQHPRDTRAMRDIWGSALDQDPYYNPNLSREFPDCRLSRDHT